MNAFEKSELAASAAEEKLGFSLYIGTNDRGHVSKFYKARSRKIPGQHTTPPTAYVSLFRKPISRSTIAEIAQEIVEQL